MRPDLQELEINERELQELTGVDLKSNAQDFQSNGQQLLMIILMATASSLFNGIIYNSINFLIIVFLIMLLFLSFVSQNTLTGFIKSIKKRPKLIKEVNQYNQLIKNIDTLDQLEEIGNPVKLNQREKFIQALKINRENLVRALQTERILKENPKFRPEQFNIDLTGLQTLQATEKATEYGRFFDEALQIEISVQEEMRKLENQRLK